MKDKIKHFFDYKKRFKNQKHKNKRLKKKINKLTNALISELRLDITNDEIIKLKKKVIEQDKTIKKLSLDCQIYFGKLMDELHKNNIKKIIDLLKIYIIDDELEHDCCEEAKSELAVEILAIIEEEDKNVKKNS